MICTRCAQECTRTSPSQKYCASCRHAVKILRHRRWRDRNQDKSPVPQVVTDKFEEYRNVKVLFDPDKEACLAQGATLSRVEMRMMLEGGTFTPYTMLSIDGKKKQVTGKIGYRQKLVEL